MERRNGCGAARFGIAGVIALIAVIGYFSSSSQNPITGEKQHVDMSTDQEIALGLQAAPQMMQEFGGEDRDPEKNALVDQIGNEVVKGSVASKAPYRFEFHLLADQKTINAFALPGGQVFITRALLDRLTTRGQLAGVLGHEVGHVVARHGAEHMAKAKLTQGLTGAAVMATYDPNNPNSAGSAVIAQMVGQMVNMKYGRDDEIESDKLGVKFLAESGYDPRAMIEVMKILKEAGGGGRQPEFFSSHPNPENRIERIQQAIKDQFPNGLPNGLKS
ncbi:MAG: M48 family metalloprotease [Chlorobia bacterium]|nr:M48 family metalloprotease [Fimbriimonadaceae bacterium]